MEPLVLDPKNGVQTIINHSQPPEKADGEY